MTACGLEIAQRIRSHAVERRHRRDRGGQHVVVDGVLAQRVRDDAGAERLGEHEDVADLRAGVAPDAVGMHEPGDGEAVERLGGRDRVPAEDRRAGRDRDVGPAAQDLAHVARPAGRPGKPPIASAKSGSPPIAKTSEIAFVAAMRP